MNAVAEDTGTQAPRKAAPAAETVAMADGRQVEFVGKRKMLKESVFKDDGSVDHIRLDFRNGKSIQFTIPDALLARFAAHGAEQKLGDETAGEEDVDDMYLAVEDLVDRLNKGEWNVRREGGGMAGTSVLLQALVEHTAAAGNPRTPEQVREFLKSKTQAEKLALRNSPKIKPIVARLEEAKAQKGSKIDAEAVLAGL